MTVIQVQLVEIVRVREAEEKKEATPRPRIRHQTKMVLLSFFSREVSQVAGLLQYIDYIRIRVRNVEVEEQVQWILMYIQKGSADIQKENILEDMKARELEFPSVGDSLAELKREFCREYDESAKITKLKKAEQETRIIKKFVQEEVDMKDKY